MKYLYRVTTTVRNLLNPYKGSRFRRNFIIVAKANVLAQILSLLAAPILTRLYTPGDFGVGSLFTSVLSILLSFATWRFEWSVPNTKSRFEAASLISIGTIILLITCSISLELIYFGSLEKLSLGKSIKTLEPFLLFLPLALLGGGLHQLLHSWYIREAQLSAVANSKIAQSLGGTGITLLGGLGSLGAIGLIYGSVASAWLGIRVLLQQANGFKESLIELSIKDLKIGWSSFWKESTLSTGVAVINTASLSITPLLLAQYYNTTEIGWYALMYRLAITPVSLLTTSIGQSFWAEAATLIQEDRLSLKHLYIKSTKYLALAALPIIVVCLTAPFFVGGLLGKEEWNGAGMILVALIPMLFGQIVVSPLSHLVIHHKQHWQFLWDLCRLFLVIFSIFVGTRFAYSIASTVGIMAIIMLIMYAVLFLLNLKCLEVNP